MDSPTLYFASLIDVPLWDRAQWRGMSYFARLPPSTKPPLVCMVFLNSAAGLEIFRGWRERLGPVDEGEAIYLSFVEGNIQGREPGYSVLVTIDRKAALRLAQKEGIELPNALLSLSRIRDIETTNLEAMHAFKDAAQRAGGYVLAPGRVGPDGKPQVASDFTIQKRIVHFKRSEEIRNEDPEWVVLATPRGGSPTTFRQ